MSHKHQRFLLFMNSAEPTNFLTQLVVGDQVRLAAGDRVPADLRLIAANDLFVSQSVITGESAILEKNAAPLAPDRARTYGAYSNIVFMGSAVIGGAGQGVVLAVGDRKSVV